jgi:hypothetical protein
MKFRRYKIFKQFGENNIFKEYRLFAPRRASHRRRRHARSRKAHRKGLTTDPGMSVVRHVDAGYEETIEFAEKNEVKVPMLQ